MMVEFSMYFFFVLCFRKEKTWLGSACLPPFTTLRPNSKTIRAKSQPSPTLSGQLIVSSLGSPWWCPLRTFTISFPATAAANAPPMSLTIPACYYSLRLPLKVCRTVSAAFWMRPTSLDHELTDKLQSFLPKQKDRLEINSFLLSNSWLHFDRPPSASFCLSSFSLQLNSLSIQSSSPPL